MTDCGGTKTDGTLCTRPAGWGTDHPGEGKCKLHGGASLKGPAHPNFKHGRYADAMKRAVKARLSTGDDDPLDILPELEAQRLFFAEYLSQFKAGRKPQAEDIGLIIDWASEITKTAERVVKMRNETALTKAEVTYLAARVVDVIGEFISDPEQQQAFIERLFGGLADANLPALASQTG